MSDNKKLQGTWQKKNAERCREVYPDVLVFREKGIYMSELNTPSDRHPVWDVGTYELTGGELRLSTSNDRIVGYPCKLSGNRLLITAEEDCELAYLKVS